MPYEAKYIGPDLAKALVPESLIEETRQTMRDLTADGRDALFHAAKEATPVDSGATREQWIAHPVERDKEGRYVGRVSNSSKVAKWLEYGTQPHIEEGDMSWTDPLTGRTMHSGRVLNPGIKARHMTARAATAVHAELPAIMRAGLEAWKVGAEATMLEGGKGL